MTANIDRLYASTQRLNIDTMFVAYYESFFKDVDLAGRSLQELLESDHDQDRLFYDLIKGDIDFPLAPKDLVAGKTHFSAYQESSIANYVASRGVTTVILSGVFEATSTDLDTYCVSHTARDFSASGYNVVIAAETTNVGNVSNTNFLPLSLRQHLHATWNVDIKPIDALMRDLDSTYRPEGQTVSGYRKATLAL